MSKTHELSTTCPPTAIDEVEDHLWRCLLMETKKDLENPEVMIQNHLFDPDVTVTVRAHTVRRRK